MSISSASPSSLPLPVSREVFRAILDGYALDPRGIHGAPHWARVLENGRRIGLVEGTDPLVVGLFAVFHDARRLNDDWDPDHGRRGAGS